MAIQTKYRRNPGKLISDIQRLLGLETYRIHTLTLLGKDTKFFKGVAEGYCRALSMIFPDWHLPDNPSAVINEKYSTNSPKKADQLNKDLTEEIRKIVYSPQYNSSNNAFEQGLTVGYNNVWKLLFTNTSVEDLINN